MIATLTQSTRFDGSDDGNARRFRGGSTLVVDLTSPELLKYRIVKHIDDPGRQAAAAAYASYIDGDPLRRLFLSSAEPFAALHQIVDE